MGVDPLGFMLYIRSQEQEEITVSAQIHSEVACAPSPTRSPTPEHPWCFLGGLVQIISSRDGTPGDTRSLRHRGSKRPGVRTGEAGLLPPLSPGPTPSWAPGPTLGTPSGQARGQKRNDGCFLYTFLYFLLK